MVFIFSLSFFFYCQISRGMTGQFLGNLWHASDKHNKTFGRKYEICCPPLLVDLLHLLGILSVLITEIKALPFSCRDFMNILQVLSQITFPHWLWYCCPPEQEFISIHISPPSLPLFFTLLSAQYIITASVLQSRDWGKSSPTSKPKDIYLGTGEFMSCFHIGKATVHFVSLLLCSLSPLPYLYFFSPPCPLTQPYPFLPCRPEEHNMWDQTAGK